MVVFLHLHGPIMKYMVHRERWIENNGKGSGGLMLTCFLFKYEKKFNENPVFTVHQRAQNLTCDTTQGCRPFSHRDGYYYT